MSGYIFVVMIWGWCYLNLVLRDQRSGVEKLWSKSKGMGTSLVVQWLRHCAPN